ncbi:MAG: DNA cytosine methyltransferase [Gammaproteobacteria bacterium]
MLNPTPLVLNLISIPNGRLAEPSPAAVDFCCGPGGLSLAARQLGMTVIAGVDTDRDALRTFARNFPGAAAIETTISGRKAAELCEAAINSRHSEAPLLVLSGPPCQGFSAAGSRDPRDKRNKILSGRPHAAPCSCVVGRGNRSM